MVNTNILRSVATLAAILLFASTFVGGAAAAGDATTEQTPAETQESSAIPPCGTGGEATVGPVTAGHDPYCNVYVEFDKDWQPTDEASADSEPSACYQIYIKEEVGPVTYEATSTCDHNVYFDGAASQTSTIPPCGTGGEASVGPATAGYDPYCQLYVNVDDDWRPTEETSGPACLYIFYEQEAGPVTVTLTSTCSADVDVDEDWEPSAGPSPTDHRSPSDEPVKCFLTADDDVERWSCFFGPPGP